MSPSLFRILPSLLLVASLSSGCLIVNDGDPPSRDHADRFDPDDDFGRGGPRSPGFDDDFFAGQVREIYKPLKARDQPDSPTNMFADDPQAASFGQRLFFDRRMSSDGTVACVSCHSPEVGFSDPFAVSEGVRGRLGNRHAPSVLNAGFLEWALWDGRADSIWSQPLKAIEARNEMDFSRVEVLRFVAENHAEEYQDVFGSLPNTRNLPRRAFPGDPAWEELSEAQKDEVNKVFANIGKAIEAYQRTLLCVDTRFDRFLDGEDTLAQIELDGALAFNDSGCAECHSGPTFSDNDFHNIGIGSIDPDDARGRANARELLLDDTFSGIGRYSDNFDAGRAKLNTLTEETNTLGSFKTPSLRGVTQREVYMHNGTFQSLNQVMNFYSAAPTRQEGSIGNLAPEFSQLRVNDREGILAFLDTLACPTLPASRITAPGPYRR